MLGRGRGVLALRAPALSDAARKLDASVGAERREVADECLQGRGAGRSLAESVSRRIRSSCGPSSAQS
jgi:hypothetical protein